MDDNVAFTIRIPRDLRDQIDARARINRRKRNGEINVLLENAIDSSVSTDLEVIKSTADRSQSE